MRSRSGWAFVVSILFVLTGSGALAQDAGRSFWIWGPWSSGFDATSGEKAWFRRTFDLAAVPAKVPLLMRADNHLRLWVNGAEVAHADDWMRPLSIDLARRLRVGANVLAIEVRNDGGPAGLVASLGGVGKDGATLVTDHEWQCARTEIKGWRDQAPVEGFVPARELCTFGGGPWGAATQASAQSSEPPHFELPAGFTVEEVASGIGSLINCCAGPGGTLFVSVEGSGILRLADRDGDGTFEESVPWLDGTWNSQGLCWSKDHLFVVGNGPEGAGLYRIDEAAGERHPVLLGGFEGGIGEHGPHAIVEGPDGRLWLAVGNHARVGARTSPDSPYRITYEGHILPALEDPNGHAVGIKAPGGVIATVDHEGKDWQIFAGGFRNSYDLAFDRQGACFTFDSDMEWDIGLPWYRPVRLYHVVPGGEYGWRTGSKVWPDWYPDMLPAVVEVGRGSPTGMLRYEGAGLPPQYRGAILAGDWSQGRILAFHVAPHGSSYDGTYDVLLSGRPLNVTDLAVSATGDLLFTTGGRGSRGAVFRLKWKAPAEAQVEALPHLPRWQPPCDTTTPPSKLVELLGGEDRAARFLAARELERRGWTVLDALDLARLNEPARIEWAVAVERLVIAAADPRNAGRIAAPGPGWKEKVARVALANVPSDGPAPPPAWTRPARLRVRELLALIAPEALAREGDPPPPLERTDRGLLRESAELATWSARHGQDPSRVISDLLVALETEPSQEDQIFVAYCLRAIPRGWSHDQAARFVQWLGTSVRWNGGASFAGYLADFRNDVQAVLDPELARQLAAAVAAGRSTARVQLTSGAPVRDFDFTARVVRRTISSPRRSPAEGAAVFQRSCAPCHRIGNLGNAVGPDLATVAARFSLDDQIVAVMQPSRQISDQYRSSTVFRKDDPSVSGLIVERAADHLTLLQGTGDRIRVEMATVEEVRPSAISVMPEHLLDGYSLEQVADLFSFLMAPAGVVPPAASSWRSMFDGEHLVEWEGEPALWSVDHGVIAGKADGRPLSTFLVSRDSFSDFAVEFEVMLGEGNSGLQFRSQRDGFRVTGYQADVGEAYWGALYEEGLRGMLHQPAPELWRPELRVGDWNHYVVEAHGHHLHIELNGIVTTDLTDESGALRGCFGFQLHARSQTDVHLRQIRIRTFDH